VIQPKTKLSKGETVSCSCGKGGFQTLEEWIQHTEMMGEHILVFNADVLCLCKETGRAFRDPPRRNKGEIAQ